MVLLCGRNWERGTPESLQLPSSQSVTIISINPVWFGEKHGVLEYSVSEHMHI